MKNLKKKLATSNAVDTRIGAVEALIKLGLLAELANPPLETGALVGTIASVLGVTSKELTTAMDNVAAKVNGDE